MQQTSFRSQRLLHLDCSADLQSYSGGLGLDVQTRRSDGMMGALLSRPDDGFTRHAMNAFQSLFTSHGIATTPRVDAWRQTLPVPPTPTSPVQGDFSTYPPALLSALSHCHVDAPPLSEGTHYQVIEDVQSTYMGDSQDVVETYGSLREANASVADHFLFGGTYSSGRAAGEEPQFEALGGRRLRCAMQTDGSMDVFVEIFVREVSLKKEKSWRR